MNASKGLPSSLLCRFFDEKKCKATTGAGKYGRWWKQWCMGQSQIKEGEGWIVWKAARHFRFF
jgi:hypothetical protein